MADSLGTVALDGREHVYEGYTVDNNDVRRRVPQRRGITSRLVCNTE
jgi:hypothetical protein